MTKPRIILFVFILALALRLISLGSAQFWYDESFTVAIAQMPFDQIAGATAGDTHPFMYYQMVNIFMRWFGGSEFAVRLMSVILSLAGMFVFWLIIRHLQMPDGVEIAALGIMAVAPTQLHYAQEARMYTLLQMLVLLAVYGVLRRDWLLIGLSNLVMLYTHNYSVFYIPTLALIGFAGEFVRPKIVDPSPEHDNQYRFKSDQCQFGSLAMSFYMPVLLYIPWLIVLLGQMQQLDQGYWIQPVTGGAVIYSLYMLLWGFYMPEFLQPLAAMVTVGLLTFIAWRVVTERKYIKLFVFTTTPLLLAILAGFVWQPVLLFRGLIGCAPILYLLIAWAIMTRPLRFQYFALGMVGPLVVAGVIGYYTYNPSEKGTWKTIIDDVRQQWQPGDAVYHTSTDTAVIWRVYAPDLDQYMLDVPCGTRAPGSLSNLTIRAFGLRFAHLPTDRRVWVIGSLGPMTTDCEAESVNQVIDRAKKVIPIRDDKLVSQAVYQWQK